MPSNIDTSSQDDSSSNSDLFFEENMSFDDDNLFGKDNQNDNDNNSEQNDDDENDNEDDEDEEDDEEDEDDDDYDTFKSSFDDHTKMSRKQKAENDVKDALAKQRTDMLLQAINKNKHNKRELISNIIAINTITNNENNSEQSEEQLVSPTSSNSSDDNSGYSSEMSKENIELNDDEQFINYSSNTSQPIFFKILQFPINDNDNDKSNNNTIANSINDEPTNDTGNDDFLSIFIKSMLMRQLTSPMNNNNNANNENNDGLPHLKKQCTESNKTQNQKPNVCNGVNKCFRNNCNYNCELLLALVNNKLISQPEIMKYHKYSRQELERILKETTRLTNTYSNDKNKLLLMRILDSKMSDKIKNICLELVKEIISNKSPIPISTGNDKQQYLNGLLDVPFGLYKSIAVNNVDNTIDECSNFLLNVYDNLNKTVYGMNNAKMQVCQIVSSLMTSKNVKGLVIGLHGPAGTGKTSLIKNGLSKSLGIPMEMFPLGGIKDGSTLIGKMSTYVNSKHGSILTALKNSKCMNPILYFDELDKVGSDTSNKSNEIENVLIHLTDPIQNDTFKDEYYDGIEFDLSKAIIVFSYNDESKINPILLDRILKIEVSGYDKKEMVIIARDYLIPDLFLNYGIDPQKMTIPNAVIEYIYDNYTPMERGVRPIKQYLSHLITFVNTLSYLPKPSVLGEHLKSLDELNFKYPLVMTKEMVKRIIGNTGELRQKIGLSEVAKSMFI